MLPACWQPVSEGMHPSTCCKAQVAITHMPVSTWHERRDGRQDVACAGTACPQSTVDSTDQGRRDAYEHDHWRCCRWRWHLRE